MPTGIVVLERIIEHIAVTIEALGIPRVEHNRIGADEASQLRIVPAGIVEVQPLAAGQSGLVILAGEVPSPLYL